MMRLVAVSMSLLDRAKAPSGAVVLICPSCQSAAVGVIDLNPKSKLYPPRPASHEGRLRDRHGRWVRDAVDAAAAQTSAAKADGEVVWS
jgi:hypothetical protein